MGSKFLKTLSKNISLKNVLGSVGSAVLATLATKLASDVYDEVKARRMQDRDDPRSTPADPDRDYRSEI